MPLNIMHRQSPENEGDRGGETGTLLRHHDQGDDQAVGGEAVNVGLNLPNFWKPSSSSVFILPLHNAVAQKFRN